MTRRRLVQMAKDDNRSMNNFMEQLINMEWETRAAYQERESDNGAQNPEPEPTV